jgi:TolA-binding protein
MKETSLLGKKYLLFWLFFAVFLCTLIGPASAQTGGELSSLQSGINLYGAGRWREAVIELRRAQAEAANAADRGEVLYWIALAELAAGEYDASLRDLEELERIAPQSPRIAEIPYHRGRAFYYKGQYEDALMLLKTFSDGINNDSAANAARKSSALYWIGECLYSLGQLDKAQEVFLVIIQQYPQSAKFEASSYRNALINQKKVEAELLSILKWSHEETLKTVEEYQRRERSYDQAIIAYQKRIAEMMKDTRVADLELSNSEYRRQLADAEARIALLEARLGGEAQRAASVTPPPAAPASSDRMIRLLSAKNSALEINNELNKLLNETEAAGAGEGGR